MQGHLRGEALTCLVTTEYAHSHRPLHVEIDSALNFKVREDEARPLVYAPMMDRNRLGSDPSIIDFF